MSKAKKNSLELTCDGKSIHVESLSLYERCIKEVMEEEIKKVIATGIAPEEAQFKIHGKQVDAMLREKLRNVR